MSNIVAHAGEVYCVYAHLGKQIERLRRLISRVTYKPDWVMLVLPTDRYYITVSFKVPVRDAANPSETITLTSEWVNSWEHLEAIDDNVVFKLLMEHICMMERHEAQEWFKVDGVAIFDPHKGGM